MKSKEHAQPLLPGLQAGAEAPSSCPRLGSIRVTHGWKLGAVGVAPSAAVAVNNPQGFVPNCGQRTLSSPPKHRAMCNRLLHIVELAWDKDYSCSNNSCPPPYFRNADDRSAHGASTDTSPFQAVSLLNPLAGLGTLKTRRRYQRLVQVPRRPPHERAPRQRGPLTRCNIKTPRPNTSNQRKLQKAGTPCASTGPRTASVSSGPTHPQVRREHPKASLIIATTAAPQAASVTAIDAPARGCAASEKEAKVAEVGRQMCGLARLYSSRHYRSNARVTL